MTVSPTVEADIRRLYFAEHWKRGTIAAQLKIHPDAVDRVIGQIAPAPVVRPPRIHVDVEPFVGFIDETLLRYPSLVGSRLYDMLVDRGYKGSLRTLRKYLRRARPRPKSEAFLRISPLIAEQGQVDWAHVGYLEFPGGKRPLWVFVFVLAYSRALWAELVLDLSVHSLRRSLLRSASYFGGCPRQWLFDNPKTVVVERHGDIVRFHPSLLELAGLLRVEPRVCGVRKPHEKGRVERAVRFLRERFFAARKIHSIEQGNAQLIEFFTEIADKRPHPQWPERTVGNVLDEERARLLSLPDAMPTLEFVKPIVADKTAFVRFDGNAYSVPSAFARQTLTLAADDKVVRLLDGPSEVALHIRSWGRHQWIEDASHRAQLLAEKRAGREPKGRDRLHAVIPGIDGLYAAWVEFGRNTKIATMRTTRLLDLYGAEVLSAAVEDAIARKVHDPSALAVLCEQIRKSKAQPIPMEVDFGYHVPDRDVIPHDLGGYDE